MVTDGNSVIGSAVSIATNQSTLQTVTGLQHVSYQNADSTEDDYLYVFGEDVQSIPYFGVIKLVASPVTGATVAAALQTLEVRSTSFSHFCRRPLQAELVVTSSA